MQHARFCAGCAHEFADASARFCPNCGRPRDGFTQPAAPATAPPPTYAPGPMPQHYGTSSPTSYTTSPPAGYYAPAPPLPPAPAPAPVFYVSQPMPYAPQAAGTPRSDRAALSAKVRVVFKKRGLTGDGTRYQILLDDAPAGSISMGEKLEVTIRPGSHTLKARQGPIGPSTGQITFQVAADGLATFKLDKKRGRAKLQRTDTGAAAPVDHRAALLIVAVEKRKRLGGNRSKLKVLVDDEYRGSLCQGERTELQVPPGQHTLKMKGALLGPSSGTQVFTCAGGDRIEFFVEFKSSFGNSTKRPKLKRIK
eukprot:gnl/Chilomastix_cuspidata/3359.p1 GENE.gnl/Chilomastix_cuspidata/3359~~gnl/Chilomastix_cuspidata/3359.p1  ORF type:complete len:309 (-),score=47.72 gnl/Chilomastix_cuspidata/3359:95-1021(-)